MIFSHFFIACLKFFHTFVKKMKSRKAASWKSKDEWHITYKWREEDDQMLEDLFERYPRQWTTIASKMKIGITPGQVMTRYARLHPKHKARRILRFTAEEDEKILQLVEKGGYSWTMIAKELGTNRYYSSVHKRYTEHLKHRKLANDRSANTLNLPAMTEQAANESDTSSTTQSIFENDDESTQIGVREFSGTVDMLAFREFIPNLPDGKYEFALVERPKSLHGKTVNDVTRKADELGVFGVGQFEFK